MKLFASLNQKLFVIIIIVFAGIASAKAQMSPSILADTVSSQTASFRRTSNTVVNFDVDKLNTLLTACLSRGIANVQFVFVQIRVKDTAQYFARHPNVANADRAGHIGKPTLLIKVPRSAFGLALNENPENNGQIKHMLANGFYLITASYSGSSPLDAYLYFDSGAICPPPVDCQ